MTRSTFASYKPQNYANFRGYIQEFPKCTLHAHVVQPMPLLLIYSFH